MLTPHTITIDNYSCVEFTEVNNATTNSSIIPPINATKSFIKANHKKNNIDKEVTTPRNRSIVKRNADDSNLIFWNDMYDDEYGIDVDHLESNIRDKYSAMGNNFIKSSGVWFQDKVRKLTDNFYKRPKKVDGVTKIRKLGDVSKSKSSNILKRVNNKINKRDINLMDEEGDADKVDFVALTANMKEICRKAARDVQHTKNIEVREESKDTAVASSLMQQLVQLMTDLVDFQVEQKTCLKLPPDLQNFLEWLTSNDDTDDVKRAYQDVDGMFALDSMGNYDKTDSYLELLTATTEKEGHAYDRYECLGALRSVEDLMRQYEDMDDGDKSKMTGIKVYLDNQLDFLQKQLNSIDFYNTYQKTEYPLKLKRSLPKNDLAESTKRTRRNFRKFIKSFGKKQTKTTTRINGGSSLNDTGSKDKGNTNNKVRPQVKSKEKISNARTIDENNDANEIFLIKNGKRNLKDVYYKAMADAKKSTTVKHFHI